MKKIAFFPLTPLGDCIAQMAQLKEIKRLYAPCHITVFAIPLIAELFRNYKYCDEAVELEGKIHGPVNFRNIPQTEFDVVFNHGYNQYWSSMLRQIKYKEAYGMEEIYRSQAECEELFTEYVPLDYWKNVTLKKYQFVAEQMGEVLRLVNPDYRGAMPQLDESNYHCSKPAGIPAEKYVLFLPGTSTLLKYWPIEKYLQLAKYIESSGFTAVFVTGPQDNSLKKDLQASGFIYFDNLSLSELAYAAAHAELVIGNDSGPMHLARSFDTPTMSFFSFSGAHNWFQYKQQKRHKVLMLPCGDTGKGCKNKKCHKVCIGKISLSDAINAAEELLHLPHQDIKQIAYLAQHRIGDALVHIENIKALSNHYAPCSVTVFCNQKNRELFDNYAFCDNVFSYTPGALNKADLPKLHFSAVFNDCYDQDSLHIIQQLDYDCAYGYENGNINEDICKQYYTNYLPLSLWDNFELRRKTSVTEQGAELIRLVDPNYHCQRVSLQINTFLSDIDVSCSLPEKSVIFVTGASDKSKSLSVDSFIELAKLLQKKQLTPLFLTGPQEKKNAEIFRKAGFSVGESLSFTEIASIFVSPKTKLVIGNDTGVMHLACMFDVPGLTISCHGSSYTWFPYDRKKHKLCTPECTALMCINTCKTPQSCASKIKLQSIIDELEQLLDM